MKTRLKQRLITLKLNIGASGHVAVEFVNYF